MRKSTAIRKKRKAWKRKQKALITNSKVRDSGSKMIFDEHILYAQFLRDYVDLPCMKDLQPEDIKDVSPQFVPMFAEERNADRVKRIDINGANPFFLISLIEHKTEIEYDVCMQIFRYMIYIWEAYAKEEEKKHKGISKLKDFKYPPILPIVYYEGSRKWTASLNFLSRVNQGELFSKYVPDFQYYLVPLRDYTNEELLKRGDEMSLVMVFNKLQTKEDIEEFRKIAPERLEEILRETPKHLLDIMAKVLLAFLLKENVPVEEAEELVGKVREKKVGELFANMEKMDIQAERNKTKKQEERADKAEERADKAEERADKAEERADKAEERADKAEERADRAEVMAEIGIQLFIENSQRVSVPKTNLVEALVEKFGLSWDEAEERMIKYWKE